MSIFNPWAEVRKLKAQLEAGYETYRVEETQQQAEWAEKGALLEELKHKNARLRGTNTTMRRANKKLRDRLKEADKRNTYLHNVATKNSSLYAEETHRSAQLAKTLKEQDALVIMLHEKLAEAVDPRDPKTGRFTKKAK
jgi:predicted RNase H-like nuclease (RuvC/YqgF family)